MLLLLLDGYGENKEHTGTQAARQVMSVSLHFSRHLTSAEVRPEVSAAAAEEVVEVESAATTAAKTAMAVEKRILALGLIKASY